jgi:hypothetical protein
MAQHDLDLIHLVTRRFGEIQGLRTALNGVTLLAVWAILGYLSPQKQPVAFGVAATLWAALSMWGEHRVRLHYAARFGRVVKPGSEYEHSFRSLPYYPQLVLLVSTAVIMGGWFGVVVLSSLALRFAFVAWRDRPHRTHWLLPALVGGGFFVAFTRITNLAQFRDWQWHVIVAGGLSLIVVGLLDHGVLLKGMHSAAAAEPAQSTEHVHGN